MKYNKLLKYFKTQEQFDAQTIYVEQGSMEDTFIDQNGEEQWGDPDIYPEHICFIEDTKTIFTHNTKYVCLPSGADNCKKTTISDILKFYNDTTKTFDESYINDNGDEILLSDENGYLLATDILLEMLNDEYVIADTLNEFDVRLKNVEDGGNLSQGTNISIDNNTISAVGYKYDSTKTSFATGYETQANGEFSFTAGRDSKANGQCASAIGENTKADGSRSHAEGYLSQATSNCAHAEGYMTKAEQSYAHAEGQETKASGKASHAEGSLSIAEGEASHAEGRLTTASGKYSHTEGNVSSATAICAHAEGSQTTATGKYSHTEGYISKTGGTYSSNNLTASTDTTSGSCAHAEGNATIAQGLASHSEGRKTFALGNYSHAEGNVTTASGTSSHAEGSETKATSVGAHSEGRNTVASGNASHAEGNYSKASGTHSHAEGYYTESNGSYSHAEGSGTIGIGESSHAEGYKTTASGKSSHAEGNGVETIGIASHAEGWHDIDSSNNAIYNVYQDANDNKKYHIVSDLHGTDGGEDGAFYLKHGMTFLYNNVYYYVTNVFYADGDGSIIKPIAFRLNQTIDRPNTDQFEIKLVLGKSIGTGSHTEGCNAVAYGAYAHAEGNSTRAAGNNSHTEGVETSALGSASHAEGNNSIAVGEFSHVEGYTSRAEGFASHTEGSNSYAEGSNSHAEGHYSHAQGFASHAEGTNSNAESDYSHAEGSGSHTEGFCSHAEGLNSHTKGDYSHTEGWSTITRNQAEHAEGAYNISNQKEEIVINNNDYEYIDLGLPSGLLWATCNVGAETPQDNGLYFDWGNVEGHRVDENGNTIDGYSFDANTYADTLGGQYTGSELDVEHDAATVNMGGNWRMPTIEEIRELVGYTDHYYIGDGGNIVDKSELTISKKLCSICFVKKDDKFDYDNRSNFIEISFAGNCYISSLINEGIFSCIWSSSVNDEDYASELKVDSGGGISHRHYRHRCEGISVRGVITPIINTFRTRSSIGIGTNDSDRKNAFEVMQNGDTYLIGVGNYDGTNPDTATTLQECINGGVSSQSFGGYVYIEKYDKTDFENALTTALTEAKTEYDNGTNKNAVILDCTYFTGIHTLSAGFTGFNLETPVKLVFGSIKVVFNNPGDHNLFNILHNDISIVGINRNTDASQIATDDTVPNGATVFIMNGDNSNSSDNLNGYHIKSTGHKNILIDSITLKGKRSEIGEYYQSTSHPISGIGGIYIEKGDPSDPATSGQTCNNVRINNLLISDTKAHGIYINTPILSSITNTRLSGCGGHGIYILGGTSINMENVYASSGNFAGFCVQNASYVQLANCVSETFGIGFLIRGSNSVTLHCPGVEQPSNFGRLPWRNTLTEEETEVGRNSNKIYGLGLLHTGTNEIIKDVVNGLDTCFIGYGIYITGGDGINVFSPYIKSIGQSKSNTYGYPDGTTPSAQLNFISIVGEANLVNVINPHFKMSEEKSDLSVIQTIKNEIKIGKYVKYVDISYSTDSSPLKKNIESVLKYTTNSSDKACIYTEDGENGNIDTITLKIDNVYENLYAKTIHYENGLFETSDARKKDIQGELPIDKAYDFIRNCEPILYNLKGSNKTQIGLIAQEVREFFPEIVNEDNEGYLSLDYAKLSVIMLRVLKDLIDNK